VRLWSDELVVVVVFMTVFTLTVNLGFTLSVIGCDSAEGIMEEKLLIYLLHCF